MTHIKHMRRKTPDRPVHEDVELSTSGGIVPEEALEGRVRDELFEGHHDQSPPSRLHVSRTALELEIDGVLSEGTEEGREVGGDELDLKENRERGEENQFDPERIIIPLRVVALTLK